MAYLGIFDQKCLTQVFLGDNFRKTIAIFEISTLKIVQLQNFTKKSKCLNLGPHMPDLGIFGFAVENKIVISEISIIEFVSLQNFAEKQKCLNSGPKCLAWVFLTKNALFGYFWARILKTFVLFKSAPSNLRTCKILWKNKNT